MKHKHDIIIVGGGVVGCAIAYKLAEYKIDIAVLEKNVDVCMGTSGKNSAVIHAGFNNKPGSLMAELCVEGNKRFEEICRLLRVPYKKSGKLVVGFNEEDRKAIEAILEQGKKNGCVGLEFWEKEDIVRAEPYAGGCCAMYSGNTAVINPFLYNIHLAETAMRNGVSFYLNSEVKQIERKNNTFVLKTPEDEFCCDTIINAAGLYSDEVAALAGDKRFKIYPCRGQYYILDKKASQLLHRPVYPVPRKGVGGLGVHLTVTIDGNVMIGPSAEYVSDKEEYATTPEVMKQLMSEAIQLFPGLKPNMVIGSYTGIRSKIVAKGEENFGDFIIEESQMIPNLINLIGIESPGLTASIPIAERVVDIVRQHYELEVKEGYSLEYEGVPLFRDCDIETQDMMIHENPDYGKMICRCERITKGDIIQALNNPLKAQSVISVKNRTRATMGRCQGGHCFSKIIEIMEEELNLDPKEMIYRKPGDRLFVGELK